MSLTPINLYSSDDWLMLGVLCAVGNPIRTLNLIKVYWLSIYIRTLNLNFVQTQSIKVYSPNQFSVMLYFLVITIWSCMLPGQIRYRSS